MKTNAALVLVVVAGCADVGSSTGWNVEAVVAGDAVRNAGVARYEVERLGEETIVRMLDAASAEVGTVYAASDLVVLEAADGDVPVAIQLEGDVLDVSRAGETVCVATIQDQMDLLLAVLADPAIRPSTDGRLVAAGERLSFAADMAGCVGRICTTTSDCSSPCYCDNPTGAIRGGTCKKAEPAPVLAVE